MHIKFIIFLSVMLIFIFGMHFAFFRSLVSFFNISSPVLKTILYTAMIFLTFSFITSFFLLHWRENIWTIGYYKFSATWMGFLINFVLAVAAAWLVIGITGMVRYPVSPKLIAAVLLPAAVFWGVYGIWSAFHPVVRPITVKLKNLPAAWENHTIVQLSDVHLGYFNDRQFAKRIVRQVNALNPDLVVITGDLLDGMGGSYDQLVEPLNHLKSKHGILFVTGNHEYYIGIQRALNIIRKTKLRILNNEMIDIDGLEIIGVSYPGIHNLSDIANLPDLGKDKGPRILLFHTPTNLQINGGAHSDRHASTYWMPDTTYALNKKLDPVLQLSGHTHDGQIFPFNLLTHWLFNGHNYGLTREGDFQLYTTCGTGTWGPPMRTAGRPEIVLFRLESAGKK